LHTSLLEQQSALVEQAEPSLRQHLCEAGEQLSPLSQHGMVSVSQVAPSDLHVAQRAVGDALPSTVRQVYAGLPSASQGQSRSLLHGWMHLPPEHWRPGRQGVHLGLAAFESQLSKRWL
jgi:hypothetical protein